MEYTILRYGGNFMLMPGTGVRGRQRPVTENALVAASIRDRRGKLLAASRSGVRQDYGIRNIEVYSRICFGSPCFRPPQAPFCLLERGHFRRNKPLAGDTVAVEPRAPWAAH
jgi:hypothetical protein